MALLELGGKKFTIPVGEVMVGSDAGCAISLAGAAVLPHHAVFEGQPDGQVVIRKATPAAEVLINGVRLGAEPTPLLHGDKVEVGGHELTFVDERRTGSTQFVKAFTPATAGGPAKPGVKPPAIGVTGGRVVSLTDGREYVITGASLVFGREAGCDVVVAGKDVSLRHPLHRGRPLARRRPRPQRLRRRHRWERQAARRRPRPAPRNGSDTPCMVSKRSCRRAA